MSEPYIPLPPMDHVTRTVGPFPTLRFGVGDRVECNMGSTSEKEWTLGTVERLFYRERNFPSGMCAPYQVLLDDGTSLIYATHDNDHFIRASAEPPKRDWSGRPAGMIDPRMPPEMKAERYVELALAPSGQAMLMGEEAMVFDSMGSGPMDGPLGNCNADELEVIASIMGLSRMLDANPDSVAIQITLAMQRSPAFFGVLCSFIAYTPDLRENENDAKAHTRWGFEGDLKGSDWPVEGDYAPQQVYDGTNYKGEQCFPVRLCEFTPETPGEGGAPFKCVERYLELSPPQRSKSYFRVMSGALELLGLIADVQWPGSDQTFRRLCACASFVPCVQRLMELVARWDEAVPYSMPAFALRVLANLCGSVAAPRVRWLVRAWHVFERRYDAAAAQWEKVPADIAADPRAGGFFGVLSRCTTGGLGDADDARNARVLMVAAQGGASAIERCGRPAFPALPPTPPDVEACLDELLAASGGVALSDADTDELACADDLARNAAILFLLDSRFLPTGRRVVVHGVVSRPDLNGAVAVVAAPRTRAPDDHAKPLRYPVRPLGAEDALMLRPRNLRLAGSGDAPCQGKGRGRKKRAS